MLAVLINKMGGAWYLSSCEDDIVSKWQQSSEQTGTVSQTLIPIHVSHAHTHTYTHTPSPGTVSDDMADAIVNFKQSTEYKCDKLGYLSAPVGKVHICYFNCILVTYIICVAFFVCVTCNVLTVWIRVKLRSFLLLLNYSIFSRKAYKPAYLVKFIVSLILHIWLWSFLFVVEMSGLLKAH